jgi:hAT family C-terminal dimerisation region
MELLLQPFQELIKHLESNAIDGHHGSIWEALPAIELLLNMLETAKMTYKHHEFLSTSVNLAWSKLDDYYKLIDNTPIYAAALFLHPRHQWGYFKQRWNTKLLRSYQKSTQQAIRRLYEDQYRVNSVTEPQRPSEQKRDIFDAFMSSKSTPIDEFDAYLNGSSTAILNDENLFKWWANSGFTQLATMALDLLSIPAMSAETERVFSGAKLTISPNRNRFGEDIIEATECLNRWYRTGL